MNQDLQSILSRIGAGGAPSPDWLAQLRQRANPSMSSGGGGAMMPLPHPQAPVSISSHPVMSRPIAAPGPVDHSNDMNPFSQMAGGSLLPSGMGMKTPWPQMNQGTTPAPGAPFPSPGIMGASGQMPNAAGGPQSGFQPQQAMPAPGQGQGAPPGYAPNGLMQAGHSLMSMLGLGPNAGQPGAGGAGGGTQGPALIQKFMQMLHGGAGQPGMPY